MKSLPTGTVTFLFTDIEGSTTLLQRLGDSGYGISSTRRRPPRIMARKRRFPAATKIFDSMLRNKSEHRIIERLRIH